MPYTASMQKPVRLAVLVFVLFALYRARLRAANHKEAVEIANSVQDVLTNALVSDMEQTLVDLKWDNMLQQVDKFFATSRFQDVPQLLSINTTTLVERASVSVRSSYDAYIRVVHKTRHDVLTGKLPLISQLATGKLRADVRLKTSDPAVLSTFERNMELVAGVLEETTRKVVTENTDKRLAKLAYIFEQVLEWKSTTYRRFLYHVLRIRTEMDPGSQLDTWVELETQQIVADGHLRPLLHTEFFERYIGNSQGLIELLDAKYASGTDIYSELDDYFSRRASRVSSILVGQYNRVYAIRFEQIDTDALLSEDQKRNLKVYAREFRDASQASQQVVSTSIGEIRRLYLAYADRLLKEVRVLIIASFLEYEAISLRANAEGRQTCIIQFFEMRRALDEAFLFEYCKERSFDLDLTRSDFAAEFDRSLQRASTNMISLTRTGYIMYLYDQARSFLLERANFFFRDDSILLTAVKPVLTALHDDYASIIPHRLQEGIDEEISAETELARVSTWATFDRFTGNMEFSFVAELINGAKASIIGDMTAKVEEIHHQFANLSVDFVRDALNPFDFAWFQAESERFTTDDQIRYIDMKQYVIEETNEYASVIVETTRSTYTSQIASLFGKADSFARDVAEDLTNIIGATKLQSEQSTAFLSGILGVMQTSMASLLHTMRGSMLAALEESLRIAIDELEEVQGVRVQNFFNTKIQQIKDDFAVTVTDRVAEVYERHTDGIETKMLSLSATAREVYRMHIDELLQLERNYRSDVEEVVQPLLQEQVDLILADYNIVSFSARQTLLEQQMKNIAMTGARDVTSQRSLSIRRFSRKWSDARAAFRQEYLHMADEAKADFRQDVIGVVTFAKSLASDVMGYVSEVIDALQRDLFHAMETSFTADVNAYIGSSDNDLPEVITLESVVFDVGIVELTENPVLLSKAFALEQEEEGPHTSYGEDGTALPQVDEPSGLTTIDIILALMSWEDWLKAKVSEIVQEITINMEDELKQNTCRNNKPPCREGWVQYTNQPWGVECCRFDPASQGFPAWKITKMLAKEIFLSLLLDVERMVNVGYKIGTKLSSKLGNKAAKEGQEKLAVKGAAKGKKALAKGMQKYAGKSSKAMTKGIKLSGKIGGRSAGKVAGKAGVKVATTVGTKVAVKGASMGTKLMAKMGLGPFGLALLVFDVISLVLDLWDPAGYNDAQTAGLVRAERDPIEKQYAEALHDAGFDSPLLADPMFDLSPEQQEAMYEDTVMDWIAEETATFMAKNEVAFESMPDSEVETLVNADFDRLVTLVSEDPNLVTTMVCKKLENVFLQDISVRSNHRNPFTDGGKDSDRKHTRNNEKPTGILEMVLNETGVAAYNDFHQKKSKFLGSMKYNPMKRFVKRKDDYMLTQDVTSVDWFMQNMTEPTNLPLRKTRPDAVGSLAFATAMQEGSVANLGGVRFATEIRTMVDDGWKLVDVDAEEEFWIQYDVNKTVEAMLDRSKFQATHVKLAEEASNAYELGLDAMISVQLEKTAEEEGSQPVKFDDVKVVHLAQSLSNWSTDSTGTKVLKYPMMDGVDDADKVTYTMETLPQVPPETATYAVLRETIENRYQQDLKTADAELEAEAVQEFEQQQAAEKKRKQEREAFKQKTYDEIINDTHISIRQIFTPKLNPFTSHEDHLKKLRENAANKKMKEMDEEDNFLLEPDPAELAVFLNGYGQSSPLRSIHTACTSAGHGVTYNASKGLCNFTEAYCKRYGMDFFFNADLGVYDCEVSHGQQAAEYMFGTTITRSAKRFLRLGAARVARKTPQRGGCYKAVGNTRVLGNVRIKHVQNGEGFNSVQTASARAAIKSLGLSGFN